MSGHILTLATLTYMRAQLLCAMLEEKGIDCFMTNVNRIKQSAGGVNVKINESDAKRAMEIYSGFKSAYGKSKEPAIMYMRSIRRILVPVDFTDHSINAIDYALVLATKFKANIVLFNAYLDPIGNPQSYFESFAFHPDSDSIIREIEEESSSHLKNLVDKYNSLINQKNIRGVSISYDLSKGNSVDTVLLKAKEYNPGLIIIGTRGNELSGLRSFGSFTSQLIAKSSFPVLVVPSGYISDNAQVPGRICYATDFDPSDFLVLNKLVSITRPLKTRLFCVHVAQQIARKEDELKMLKLKRYLFDTLGELNIECGILEGKELQDAMGRFIESRNIDLLAISTRKRNLLQKLTFPGSTKKLLFKSNIPILVFHAQSD
jgi:nucleotide-binding universal stress UspA family protein